MKHTLIALVFISSTSLADTTSGGQTILYCPSHIECSIDEHIATKPIICKDVEDQLWTFQSSVGRTIVGTYNLKKVFASYDNGYGGEPRCVYSNIDGNVERDVYFIRSSVLLAHGFEAYLQPNSLWSVVGYQGECISNNPLSCPLIQLPELVFYTSIYPDAYGLFKPKCSYDDNKEFNFKLTYEDALNACGSHTGCTFWVMRHKKAPSNEKILLGTVTLDLTQPNLIKITNISPTPTKENNCTLKKREPFNTLQCEPN